MLVVALVAAALVAASNAWPSENFKPTEAYLQEIFKPTEYLQVLIMYVPTSFLLGNITNDDNS